MQFLLENTVFLLIGLQVKQRRARGHADGTMSDARLVGVCVAVLVRSMLARSVWVFPATSLPRLIPASAGPTPNRRGRSRDR